MAEFGMPVVLDGSYGEGGGALVRAALTMSALTLRPVRIENVRGAQRFSGLAAEDLALVDYLKASTSAETVFAEMASAQVSFLPTRLPVGVEATLGLRQGVEDNHQNAPILLNSILPILARCGHWRRVTAHGETYGHNSLGFDAFAQQTLGVCRRMGLWAEADLIEAGYGRRTGGEVQLDVEPSSLNGVVWKERGRLLSLTAVVAISDLADDIAERAVSFLSKLAQHASIDLDIELIRPDSHSPGVHISIFAEFEQGFGSATAMGARGLRVESVVQQAFEKFLIWLRSDATLDEYLPDQIAILASIAEGQSVFKVSRITQRLLTTIWVIKQFMPIPITVRGHEDEPGLITFKK